MVEPNNVATNLPLPPSSFVGRIGALATVAGHFEKARLVTLTGPAGIGKTRLAIEFGAEGQSRYPDGIWLVELAAVKTKSGVAKALAAALSVSEERGKNLIDTLAGSLREGQTLIILDNCEHVIQGCAELAEALLKKCRKLSVLCTSQESLAIPGEVVWPVPPLSLPESDSAVAMRNLSRYESLRLFIERASAVNPAFSGQVKLDPAVIEICRRLDGIPLAIELAAARVDAFTPAEILERMEDRFAFLTKGSRTALPRHRTLRSALEWSFELLPDSQRALLERLSVFAGGFTVSAAEQVCSDEDAPQDQIVELIANLAGKSLVVAERREAATRYRMLETIRQFAAEKLTGTEKEFLLRKRHLAWCISLAEKQRSAQVGTLPIGLSTLEDEHDNFRVALDWTISNKQQEPALRLAVALAHFWHFRGHFSEGGEWLDKALSIRGKAPADLRADALAARASLATAAWDDSDPVPALEESLALAQDSDSPKGIARSLSLLGFNRLGEHPESALRLLIEAVVHARESGEPKGLVLALGLCGRGHLHQADPEKAKLCFEEALEVARGDGDGFPADPLIGLGWSAMIEGAYSKAGELLAQGLDSARAGGKKYDVALALSLLGEVSVYRGDFVAAAKALDECKRLTLSGGAPFPMARSQVAFARLKLNQGDIKGAELAFEEAMVAVHKDRGRSLLPQCMLGLGQISHKKKDSSRARELFHEALAMANKAKNAWTAARGLHGLGHVARDEGNSDEANAFYHKALDLLAGIGDAAGLADCLEAIGGVAASASRFDFGARLFGAAESLRAKADYPRPPIMEGAYEYDRNSLKKGLATKAFQKAWTEGGALSTDAAVAYASRGRGVRGRPSVGWASLTPTELEVIALVRENLTNDEIAERMFVSTRTVASHLWRIFAKAGVRTRRELARAAAERRP